MKNKPKVLRPRSRDESETWILNVRELVTGKSKDYPGADYGRLPRRVADV